MEKEGEMWALMTGGDETAFEKLFQNYYAPLSHYAARFGYDVPVIEECIQELFIKIWQNRENLGQPASVKHYLFKALRNTIYNKAGARKKELYIGTLDDFLTFNLVYEPGDAVYPFSGLSDEMQHHLDQLTARQREAVYLFYFEDLSYQEIADLFQINITAAYKLVYRALDNLRSTWGPSSSPAVGHPYAPKKKAAQDS